MKELTESWEDALERGVKLFLDYNVKGLVGDAHIVDTPRRVAGAFAEFVSGYAQNPKDMLMTSFEDTDDERYDEMVVVSGPIMSTCAHHILPFMGDFVLAYIPAGKVVGLSKIPRFIDILCRRLQLQEVLTNQIAQTFFDSDIHPKGVGVQIRAVHSCMCARGVRVRDSMTVTTALRGNFKKNDSTRSEFLLACNEVYK